MLFFVSFLHQIYPGFVPLSTYYLFPVVGRCMAFQYYEFICRILHQLSTGIMNHERADEILRRTRVRTLFMKYTSLWNVSFDWCDSNDHQICVVSRQVCSLSPGTSVLPINKTAHHNIPVIESVVKLLMSLPQQILSIPPFWMP